MEKANFERIIDIFEDAGYEPQSYSGRGMYGIKCLGVVCSDMGKLLFDFFRGAIDNCESPENELDAFDQLRHLLDDLENPRTDSMGRDMIVYWPDIEWQS